MDGRTQSEGSSRYRAVLSALRRQRTRGPIRLALVASFAFSAIQALAQTPTVSVTNTTRGGSTVFYVGDTWTVTITGGAPSSAVQVCIPGSCSTEGDTDGYGNFGLSGYMASWDVGTWNETWSVGGVTATPDPLTFYVYPTSAETCNLYTSGSLAIESVDYIVDGFGDIGYQALGYTYVSGVLDPSGYCVMYSDEWDFGPSMSGSRTSLTPYIDQWYIADNGYRPGYTYDPPSYYPYFDATGLGFVAINVTNGDLYFDPVVIGLVVYYTDYY
jgi:hypothetical protein